MIEEEIIKKLKILINRYDDINEELNEMIYSWENHNDSTCDPSLQFEKTLESERIFEEIKDLIINN